MRLSRFIGNAAVLVSLALPCAARAADEPEAVYAKYHRAAMAGELEEMIKYWPAARRTEMQGSSAARKEAALKMAKLMVPRAFKLERKSVGRDNRTALLIVSGPLEGGSGRLDTAYGSVDLVMESGEWKVEEATWSRDRPAVLSKPAPAAAPAAAQARAQPATAKGAPSKGAAVVGSMSSGPERKLGVAKEPCVYKPVMSNEDMERCR